MAVMGGAQVVGEVGHQQAPLLLGAGLRHGGGLQALADALQGLAELIQLPQLAGEDLKVQLPVPQVVCRPAEGFQGGGDPPGEPVGHQDAHPATSRHSTTPASTR